MSGWNEPWENTRDISEEAVRVAPHPEGVTFSCACSCNADVVHLVTWPEIGAAFQGHTQWSPKQPSIGVAQENGRMFLAVTVPCRCGNLLRLTEDVHTIQNMAPRGR